MNPLARIMAVVAALAGIVGGLAGLVRAAALADDERLVWRLPGWWSDLNESAAWVVGIVAAAAAVAAVAYLIVALRQLTPPRPAATVQAGDAQVKTAALERLVASRLGAEIPGLAPVRVHVAWAPEGWDVSALVDAPANDLAGLRDRAVRVVGAELPRAAGGALAGPLDLEVRRFVGPAT